MTFSIPSPDAPFHIGREIDGKGLFTREIEEALLAGDIDIAVHSTKDMPVEQPAGLTMETFLPREDVRDAFVSLKYKSLADMPKGAIGPSWPPGSRISTWWNFVATCKRG